MTPLELWESAVGMAKSMARKRAGRIPGADVQDFEQAALLALWKAANHYRDDCGAAFTTYAWHHVRGELNCERWRCCLFGFKAGKAEANGKYTHKAPEGLGGLEEENVPVTRPGTLLEDRDLLSHVIRQLRTENLRTVARRYWVEGLPTATIAHQLGLSVARIEQLHREAYRDMVSIAEEIKKHE